MKGARIIVLTVALGAGGVAALLAGRSQHTATQTPAPKAESNEILVAKTALPSGKTISPQDLEWQPWPAMPEGKDFIRKSKQPDAVKKFSGLTVRIPFVAGEPLRETKLVDAKSAGYLAAILPKGMRAVSTRISPETGAGGFILPNDHVDVILTRKKGRDTEHSETLLSNIRVLAIDQTIQEKDGKKVVVGKTATLELSPRGVEKLALAQEQGTLSLALRSISDAKSDEGKSDEGRANTSVNIFRYGVKKGT
jgi:pilus assembly protein CpaB